MIPPRKHSEDGPLRKVWKALNDLRDFAVATRPAPGRNIRLRNTSQGCIINSEATEGEPAESSGLIQRMRITNIGGLSASYLLCQFYNSEGTNTEGDEIAVAVPKYLRASTYTTLTLGGFRFDTILKVNHPANDPADYVVKTLFPPYEIGQDVYALQPAGKTDVVLTGTRLEWIDANVEGRRLDTNLTLVNVCRLEAGVQVTRKILMEAGPIH